jgi:pimeloyl-ACP methyl ester carboxylesterase
VVKPEPRREGVFRVENGRKIGYAEYGAADGPVVFWFHGTPGSSRQIAPAARYRARDMGIRLIALERPGIGASTPHLYPNVAGWAGDVGNIVDQLALDHFACVGLSGGGPFVLACAAEYPDRMVAGAVLGGVAPTVGVDAIAGGVVGVSHSIAPILERIHWPVGSILQPLIRAALPLREQFLDLYVAICPEGDRQLFRHADMRAMFMDDIIRGTRRFAHAPLLDLVLFNRHWGFDLGDVAAPIQIWQGDADNIVPLHHGEHLASRLPNAELHIRPGESHLGGMAADEAIFTSILSNWPHHLAERTAS